MTINEYQKAALRTVQGTNGLTIINGALGLCGEAGEVADLVKKCVYQGHDLSIDDLALELGDVAWYIAIMAEAIGMDLETVFQMNVDKLKKRYPEGFDAKRSRNRTSEGGDAPEDVGEVGAL